MRGTSSVSVLMSVYNTEFKFVKRAIDSVLSQDYQNFELIIIDDGSDNDSMNLMLDYAKKYQENIIYIRQKNLGQSTAINRGVLFCKGDYVSILDADDEYLPNHLSNCLEHIRQNDLIASTTLTVVDKEEDYYVPDKYDNTRVIHVDDCVLFATLFGKKEVFNALKFQDMYAADSYFFELASRYYKVKKVNLRSYIYYRNNPGSICAKLKHKNSKSFA